MHKLDMIKKTLNAINCVLKTHHKIQPIHVAFETHIPKPCHKMLNPTMWYMKFAFQNFNPKCLA